MQYKTIFNKVKDGDTIRLSSYPFSDDFALETPEYVSFVQDKLATRKAIEKKYKNSNFIGDSFRVFLLNLTYKMTTGKKLSNSYFRVNQEEILNDIENIIKECYARHIEIEKILTEAFWKKDETFKRFGLDKYFIKFSFGSLYDLKNGLDRLDIFFQLNDDVRNIFIEQIVDDWGNKVDQFQDPTIYKNGQCIFSCITHEDIYSWETDD